MDLDTLADLLALADGLEDEGQLNNAKLLRAAVDSTLIRLARSRSRPADKAALLAGTERAISALTAESLPPELLAALHMARLALESWRLPHYSEIPDPYVCRVCGYVTLQPGEACPDCAAHPDTFKRIRPVYWLEALDPPAAMRHLRATPLKVAQLLGPWLDTPAAQAPEEGGWSLRQAVAHLRDAQGVLEMRVNLILDHDNPMLESKAVFEWAEKEAGAQTPLRLVFDAYQASRAKTLARLEGIPLARWFRRGRHEEFGELRLSEQVSYFAAHELVHLPQIEHLARQAA